MSTISAGLNSLASATLVDFGQRLSNSPDATNQQQVGRARWITVGYGMLVIALAFAVSKMPGNLVESVNSIIGLIGGPLLGVFFLGMFTTRANARGALIGCLAGFLVLLGIYLYQSGLFTAEKPEVLVSFIWFSLLGCGITTAVGLATSIEFHRSVRRANTIPSE